MLGVDDRYVMMPSGLILPEATAEAEVKRHRLPKAMDFFAGAGGMSLGLIQGGFEIVAAAEYDCGSVVTYMTNLCRYGEFKIHFVEDADGERLEKHLRPKSEKGGITPFSVAGSGWISGQPRSVPGVSHIFFGNVRKLTSKRILAALGIERGALDLVAGGPPCQGYSKAGKQNVYDERNSLVFEFARFICELHPKSMVMEEVPGILSMMTPDGHPVVDQFVRILEDGGFGGYEAFRKAVEAQTGGFGLLRGKKAASDTKSKTQDDSNSQTDLFGEPA